MEPQLFNPGFLSDVALDASSRLQIEAVSEWFESRGKERLLRDFHDKVHFQDFLDFAAETELFASFLTPHRDSALPAGAHWDVSRVAELTRVLGFYGLQYVSPWFASMMGLATVFQSDNKVARGAAAAAVAVGGVAAFGVSEQSHGADVYATEMTLTAAAGGGYLANGEKYNIVNGDCATTVAVFGRIAESGEYVFFKVDATHAACRDLGKVLPRQAHAAHLRLEDYPVASEEILHRGDDALTALLNASNIGKLMVPIAGLGAATHCFHEVVRHAHERELFGQRVTDLPNARRKLLDAYVRLVGGELYCDRALDYVRAAGPDDRRYLLFNTVAKMKATTDVEKAVTLLGDVIAAEGFRSHRYFSAARVDIPVLSTMEGAIAINLMLIGKFMPAYLFSPEEMPAVPARRGEADDEFLFRQGPARGLGRVKFGDWHTPYSRSELPNVVRFAEQAEAFAELLLTAAPDEQQLADVDLVLTFCEMFSLIVHGQLVLERVNDEEETDDLVDAVFELMIRDFSGFAVDLLGKRGATEAQRTWAAAAVRAPVVDESRFNRLSKQVVELAGVYEMQP